MNTMSPVCATLDLSLSEIAALSCRAARGAGFEWGEADEAAFASVWLSRAGIAWIATLLAVLDTAGRSGSPLVAEGRWRGPGALCPLLTGIALADFALLPEGPGQGELVLENVKHPLFLLPFVARTSDALSRPLRITSAGFEGNFSPGAVPILRFAGAAERALCEASSVSIGICEAGPETSRWPDRHRSTVSAANIRALSEIAMKMTVPTSAQSLAGAGAAGGDND